MVGRGLLAGLVGLFLAGCGSAPADRPKTVPVAGQVTYQGKPVAGARVEFMNDAASRAAVGTTDAEGRFRLTTFVPNDGAVPGTHQVSVVVPGSGVAKAVSSVEGAEYEKAMSELTQKTDKPTLDAGGIPARYADRRTSELSFSITKAEENLQVTLTD